MSANELNNALKTIEIDGNIFDFYLIDVLELHDVLIRMLNIIAPGMKSVESIDKDMNIGQLAGEILKNITSAESKAIIKFMLSKCLHHGNGDLSREANFNKCFSGNLGLLYKIFFKALGVYYGNLLPSGLNLDSVIEQGLSRLKIK